MTLKRILSTTIVAALMAAPSAFAQSLQIHERGHVRYVSGGVGYGERTGLRAMRHEFNLRAVFAVKHAGDYLADVRVTLRSDRDNKQVLSAVARGPWFYVRLAPGRYTLSATYEGRTLTRRVMVPGSGQVQTYLYWEEPTLVRQARDLRSRR